LIAFVGLSYPTVRNAILKLQHFTEDWRTKLLSDGTDAQYPGIAIVVIDPPTLAEFAPQAPSASIPRDLNARIIRAIDAAHPRAIGLDFYFTKETTADADRALLDAIRGVDSKIIIGAVNESADQIKPDQFAYQQRFIQEAGAPAGYINLRHDSDDVVRRTSSPVDQTNYPESFARLLAGIDADQSARPPISSASVRIAWLLPSDNNVFARLYRLGRSLAGDKNNSDQASADQTPFLIVPARQILAGSNTYDPHQADMLKNRIVLLSADLPYIDRHRTPLSVGTTEGILGVLVHAHVLAQYLDGRSYRELDEQGARLLVLGVAALGFLLSWLFWHRRAEFFRQGVATAVLLVVDAIVYGKLRLILPFTLALYAWVIATTGGHHLRTLAGWLLNADRKSGA
jgi:adenylate cyclase